MVVVTVKCLEVVNSPSSGSIVLAPDWMPESMLYIVCCHPATFTVLLSGSPTVKHEEKNYAMSLVLDPSLVNIQTEYLKIFPHFSRQ